MKYNNRDDTILTIFYNNRCDYFYDFNDFTLWNSVCYMFLNNYRNMICTNFASYIIYILSYNHIYSKFCLQNSFYLTINDLLSTNVGTSHVR